MARNVTFKGGPVALAGREIQVGDKAPAFQLIGNDLAPQGLPAGKVTILSVVPSLDTGVCDTETRRFNQEAATLPNDVKVLTVSRDLPFAQARWCGAAGVQNVVTLSEFQGTSFGKDYGVEIADGPLAKLFCRAVFVIDAAGVVRYVEYVPEIASEPNYPAVLSAARELAK